MPQNIAVGEDAEAIARFVAEYAGGDVDDPPRPTPEQDSTLLNEEGGETTTPNASEGPGYATTPEQSEGGSDTGE